MLEYIDEDLERFLIKQQLESLDREQIKVRGLRASEGLQRIGQSHHNTFH